MRLRPDALVASARRAWRPAEVPPVRGLHCFFSHYGDMAVNSYLVVDPATGEAADFDTGTECAPMLATGADLRRGKVFLAANSAGFYLCESSSLP